MINFFNVSSFESDSNSGIKLYSRQVNTGISQNLEHSLRLSVTEPQIRQ